MNKDMLGIKKEPVSTPDTSSLSTEEEGFEPPVRCRTTVFKTATISRSVTPPEISFEGVIYLSIAAISSEKIKVGPC
jgi:hypothetical protein